MEKKTPPGKVSIVFEDLSRNSVFILNRSEALLIAVLKEPPFHLHHRRDEVVFRRERDNGIERRSQLRFSSVGYLRVYES